MDEPSPGESGFDELRRELARLTGWDLGRFKGAYLRRRVDARRRSVGAVSWEDYSRVLAADPGELERLKERLTVHVTEFLRDPDVWRSIENDVLPDLLERAAARPAKELRLWSAGCSTGEEPYGLALLALRGARRQGRGVVVRVMASDLDVGVLRKAELGSFPPAALRRVPRPWLEDFFFADGGNWIAGPDLKRAVAYRQVDLFSSPAPPRVDLLLCRNVMIYFSRETQQRLLRSFHQALVDGGVFVTGKTETILGPVRDDFRCLSAPERIFQRV